MRYNFFFFFFLREFILKALKRLLRLLLFPEDEELSYEFVLPLVAPERQICQIDEEISHLPNDAYLSF